jgi:hypothetical protein
LRKALLLAALLALLAACSSEEAAPSPSPSPADRVTLHAYNVHLDPNAEEGSDAITFLVHASKTPLHVVVRGPDVDICPVPPPEGETPPCEHRKVADVRAEGVLIRATGEPVDIDEIAISYDAADRTSRLELPTIPPRPGESVCKDACNPVFEMTPFRAGKLTATSSWEGIASGKLLVESGGMSEHAYTELGKPYEQLASQEGSTDQGEVNLRTTITVPASEVGVALENGGARPLLRPSIDVRWP